MGTTPSLYPQTQVAAMRFSDRVVIVTGGAQGIGAGCVEVFAQENAKVAIVDRNISPAHELSERFVDRVLLIQADVGDPEAVKRSIDQTHQWAGRIDCLINNAGIHPPDTPIESMPPVEAMRVMQVNFLSTYAGAYYSLQYLRETRGTIINISSMTAVLGQKNSTAYAASKGAQLAFTKALALETAADGIRVNAVLPSNVDTPLMRQWASTLSDPNAALGRIAALQPLGRMATPQEIGRICLFLATDDSSFITGQGIEADGGAALDY